MKWTVSKSKAALPLVLALLVIVGSVLHVQAALPTPSSIYGGVGSYDLSIDRDKITSSNIDWSKSGHDANGDIVLSKNNNSASQAELVNAPAAIYAKSFNSSGVATGSATMVFKKAARDAAGKGYDVALTVTRIKSASSSSNCVAACLGDQLYDISTGSDTDVDFRFEVLGLPENLQNARMVMGLGDFDWQREGVTLKSGVIGDVEFGLWTTDRGSGENPRYAKDTGKTVSTATITALEEQYGQAVSDWLVFGITFIGKASGVEWRWFGESNCGGVIFAKLETFKVTESVTGNYPDGGTVDREGVTMETWHHDHITTVKAKKNYKIDKIEVKIGSGE